MCLLPGNPFSQAVEAYRDSGEALCSKGMHAVPCPFYWYWSRIVCPKKAPEKKWGQGRP